MLAILAFITFVLSTGPGFDGVHWETRLDAATARSRETNKPVLIEFWATWCTVCKGMDSDVYSDRAVAEAMGKTIAVRIDIDREQRIARKYGVAETPTLVLTDAFGNELFRFKGGLSRERVLGLLHDLPGDIALINTLAARIAAGGAAGATLTDMGRELHDAALYTSSTQYYERALRAKDRRDADTRAEICEAIARNYDALGAAAEAAKARERAQRERARRLGN
jgi:thiol:disulfide interchange protein DsbD